MWGRVAEVILACMVKPASQRRILCSRNHKGLNELLKLLFGFPFTLIYEVRLETKLEFFVPVLETYYKWGVCNHVVSPNTPTCSAEQENALLRCVKNSSSCGRVFSLVANKNDELCLVLSCRNAPIKSKLEHHPW